jgi:hypothetical protein
LKAGSNFYLLELKDMPGSRPTLPGRMAQTRMSPSVSEIEIHLQRSSTDHSAPMSLPCPVFPQRRVHRVTQNAQQWHFLSQKTPQFVKYSWLFFCVKRDKYLWTMEK